MRKIELFGLLSVSVILCWAFYILNKNYQATFNEIHAGYKDGTAVNLDKDFETEKLSHLLVEGNYIADKQSADLIATHIKQKLNNPKTSKNGTLPNLGELMKRSFTISADSIDIYGGEYLKKRVATSRENLGITDILPRADAIANSAKFDFGKAELQVKVQKFNTGKLAFLRKFVPETNGVLVQLTEHYIDSSGVAQSAIVGYAKTNNKGIATFAGLNPEGYYSVLPIHKGFEYGSAKGTSSGKNLGELSKKDRTFTFTQREHAIQPFDRATFSNLRSDNAITARTPDDFKSQMRNNLIFVLLAWWALHIFLTLRAPKNAKKAKEKGEEYVRPDQGFLPFIMILSGVCMLAMYSIHNPLMDLMRGSDMAQGIIIGIGMIALFSQINFVSFYNCNTVEPQENPYKFLGKWGGRRPIYFDIVRLIVIKISGIFGEKVKNWVSKMPEGSGYAILAIGITALLFPFGTGPEGSGVKVNLFFFQPGEIAKYLILIFFAAFFVRNAEKIQKFSKKSFERTGFRIQLVTVCKVAVALVLLLGMYLALGDMGPALVVALTFIILYSVVRGDAWQLLLGVATFLILLFAGSKISGSSQVTMAIFAVIWFAAWFCYSRWRKEIFESAIFLNIIIAAFVFGSNLPNVGERLQDRNDIYANVWNNEVKGGDQVAHGLWALSSGGMIGQGLGKGNPNCVPAFHTDMIFTSIGEEIGWIGLLIITLVLAILLLRSILYGKLNGHPFAFYLAAGIAIITGVQFIVITLGSVGIIPLTGVAVPFLSYGKVSMIMNMMAFAIVFSISQGRAMQNQEEQLKKYDLMIDAGKFAYTGFVGFLLITLFCYQFSIFGASIWRNETLIRPTLMSDGQRRIITYNPRIHLMMRELNAGNIYDRNGLLLATSDREQIAGAMADFKNAGVESSAKNEQKQRKRRYYPFGEQMFFWLGDFNNTRLVWNDSENDPRGYIAERRHLAALRGFDNLKYNNDGTVKLIKVNAAKNKKVSSFLPLQADSASYTFTDYDYSFLLPYLKAGTDSWRVERFNAKREARRDITLTADAKLQTRLQNEIQNYVAVNCKGRAWEKLRVSVVVLNAKNGELLTSANYPLPNMETLREKQGFAYSDRQNAAYTDRDLGLTYPTAPGSTAKVMSAMAGLKKLGTAAANEKYFIYYDEIIERRAYGSSADEPNNYYVTMEDAIVKSSNVYFINLVNKNDAYDQLNTIYQTVGVRIDNITPYYFDYNKQQNEHFANKINENQRLAVNRYNRYITQRDADKRKPQPEKMNAGEWQWAWGQGTMSATPLSIARIAAIVANEGKFVATQFVKDGNKMLKIAKPEPVQILGKSEANILKNYMQQESSKHRNNGYNFPAGTGGKTGTPERSMYYEIPTNTISKKTGKPLMKKVYYDVDASKNGKMNDGWYMFFIDSPKENALLAVAVRMERLGAGISGNAVRLTDNVVLKVLSELGYL